MSSVSLPAAAVPLRQRALAPVGVLLVGSLLYALVVGGGAVGFTATPLILGIVVIGAGLVGTRRRVVGSGLVLAGWGTAVLLVDHGVVGAVRTTPAYMLGVGAGLLVAAAAAPRPQRAEWLSSAAVTSFTAPLMLSLAGDVPAVGRWPIWSAVLVGWAAWEAFWGWPARRSASPIQAESRVEPADGR